MGDSMRWIAAAGIVLGAALALWGVPPAAAADRTFTLYGDAAGGWGSDGTTFSNPGPALVVDRGDNVTLVLNSTDGNRHNWFVDYDNDSSDDGAEPNSPTFRDAQITWNFTADRNGTFTYRDRFHPDTMTGRITVRSSTSPPPGTPAGDPGTVLLAVAGFGVGILAVLSVLVLLLRKPKPGASERVEPDPATRGVDRP